MDRIFLYWGKRFDPITGIGTIKKQKAMRCNRCRDDHGGWLYDTSYTYEYGPVITESVESECA